MTTLSEFLKEAKALLIRAAADKRSPMRTPAMATTKEGIPYQRTIVLRKYDSSKDEMLFYTDIRSDKVKDLNENPVVSVLFWHPRKKMQIRTIGQVEILHGDPLCEQHWNNIPPLGRLSYATQLAPSALLKEASDNLDPKVWHSEEPPLREETDYAFQNFAILKVQIEEIEILLLSYDGHRRAQFVQKDQWNGSWIVP